MKLELHPDATRNFTEKADKLLWELVSPSRKGGPSSGTSFSPDSYVSGHVTDRDIIGEPRFAEVNGTGVEVSKSFTHDGVTLGLYDESYARLLRLSQQMQRTRGLRDKVSVIWLTDTIFDWMKEKYRNATRLSMFEYVSAKGEESIQESEIWIPIAMLHIQSDFRIGRTTLKTITRKMLEGFVEEIVKNSPGHEKKIAQEFRRKE